MCTVASPSSIFSGSAPELYKNRKADECYTWYIWSILFACNSYQNVMYVMYVCFKLKYQKECPELKSDWWILDFWERNGISLQFRKSVSGHKPKSSTTTPGRIRTRAVSGISGSRVPDNHLGYPSQNFGSGKRNVALWQKWNDYVTHQIVL